MRHSTASRIALAGVLVAIVLETLAILVLNSGHLVFTTDDAYIHLALAEKLLKGHYGINLNEFSAPASSILWPFLIAPLAGSPFAEYGLLAMNTAFALLTVWVTWQILSPHAADTPDNGLEPRTLLLWQIFLVVACNLIGLVFIGMEHSLQVLLTTLILLGLIRETRTRKAGWWLVAALAVAPLVRYENLFLAGPAIVFLFVRSHRTKALAGAALIAVTLGAFSAFLHRHGAGFVPTSVIAKSGFQGLDRILLLMASTLKTNLDSSQGVLLACGIPVLAVSLFSRGRETGDRLLAVLVAAGIGMHLCCGQTGGFGRYESYIWGAMVLSIVHLNRERLGRATQAFGLWKTAAVMALVLGAACLPYAAIVVFTPLASNNIYEQQYQMHRFAVDYVDDVVAVNDLGLVSYRNGHYVLDLAGLASREALLGRLESGNDDWMQALAGRYGARVAMIYDDWFHAIPGGWIRVGELRLGKPRIATSRSVVGIYVIDRADDDRVRALLAGFAKTLPRGVRLVAAPR